MLKFLRSLFLIFLLFFIFRVQYAQAWDKYAIENDKKYNDLYAEDIVATPAKPMINQPCILTVKIKNNGTVSLFTSKGVSDFLYNFYNFQLTRLLYDTPNFDTMVNSTGYVNYRFEGYFTRIGDSDISFTADSANELDESKLGPEGFTVTLEDNNTITKKITVLPVEKTDIAIDSIELGNPFPVAGEPLDIIVTLINKGLTTLTEDTMFSDSSISADNSGFNKKTLTHDEYPSLKNPFENGEKFIYKFNGVYPNKGDYVFSFKADSNNRVPESNETNNSSSTKVKVFGSLSDVDNFAVSNVNLQNISSSSVRISWETDRKTTARILLRRLTEYNTDEPTAWTTAGLSHSIDLIGLKPGSDNYYQIVSKATATPVFTNFFHFVTLKSEQPSIISGPNVIPSGTTARISWRTDLAADTQVYYKLGSGAMQYSKSSSQVLDHALDLPGLSSGSYEYYVVSSSTASGLGSRSAKTVFNIGCTSCSNVPQVTTSADKTNTASAPVKVVSESSVKNPSLYRSLAGKIILQVESKGEAYYVHPAKQKFYFLGRPEDAFAVMRAQGIGISNKNLSAIPAAVTSLSGVDTDKDGLPDAYEDAIGTNKTKADTDGDGFSDKNELGGGYNPLGSGKISLNSAFANESKGKIFLQVENKGEAWYINPVDGKRYFLGRPADAFAVMRTLGVGISNNNFNAL